MNTAFTLCSINYLAQAKTLFDSFRQTNPGWRFVVGLVDKNVQGVDLSFLGCEVLEVANVGIEDLEGMIQRYTIVEFITAVKPFYFQYFLKTQPQIERLVYFDPDIMVFQSLTRLEEMLKNHDIVLTPHFTKPIEDACQPTEKHLFDTGVFNLGFLAIRRSASSVAMLEWWARKLRTECYLDLSKGYFVDQLWMNLVPACFDGVIIDKYPGHNMAHWNLHERSLSQTTEGYLVNGQPLVFYHFSHFHPSRPGEIAAYHTRYDFETRPELKELFQTYCTSLIKNGYFELKKVPCFYMQNERKKKIRVALKTFARRNIPLSVKIKMSKWLGR